MRHTWKFMLRGALIGAALLAATPASADPVGTSAVTHVAGQPVLPLGDFDLATRGYRIDEFFIAGDAGSYVSTSPMTGDGRWSAMPGPMAPFVTRVVVVRPENPVRFNGTVVVEWLNVTVGRDMAPDWALSHRELTREGYAYVGVSVQKMGVDGAPQNPISQAPVMPLTRLDPVRYAGLTHPGDAWSFDIFSQVGAALKSANAGGLLGPLVPSRVLAVGESQSATFLTTYINAVDPLARVYDGFFVHSRFGSGVALDSTRSFTGPNAIPQFTQIRADLRVPVLALITETDLIGTALPGYVGARRPDDAMLRVWELPGAAHVDNYFLAGTMIDAGPGRAAQLAPFFVPRPDIGGPGAAMPINPGMAQHYVFQAALSAFESWVRTGTPPASTPLMELAPESTPDRPALARDSLGLARGGIRTPWVDVPAMRITGLGNSGSFLATLGGVSEQFDQTTLARLYPGGKDDYLRQFTSALDQAIAAGHILPADRPEILEIAAINFPAN